LVTVEVPVPGRDYEVIVGRGAARKVATFAARKFGAGAIIADAAVREGSERVRGELLAAGFRIPDEAGIHFVGGEGAKTMAGLGQALDFLERARLDRGCCVIAIGGGAVGDLAGLAAALWLRGIAHVQVPTTLLAMVDSSIGGKTGINSPLAKNAIGAFWQPAGVFSDLEWLHTLPATEVQSGFGEIVKYALAMDSSLFEMLWETQAALVRRDPDALEPVVARCVSAKARVVAQDERDSSGVRAVLNYGHTLGHALESASGFSIPHGVAVAHGMRAAARISRRLDLCTDELVREQDRLLSSFGLPGPLPRLEPALVLAALPRDKKSKGGRPRWVLPREIGRAEAGYEVPDQLVGAALEAIAA
jgi:3-dehydroquinate synthase